MDQGWALEDKPDVGSRQHLLALEDKPYKINVTASAGARGGNLSPICGPYLGFCRSDVIVRRGCPKPKQPHLLLFMSVHSLQWVLEQNWDTIPHQCETSGQVFGAAKPSETIVKESPKGGHSHGGVMRGTPICRGKNQLSIKAEAGICPFPQTSAQGYLHEAANIAES